MRTQLKAYTSADDFHNLCCEYRVKPHGIEGTSPLLSWKLEDRDHMRETDGLFELPATF
jgi:hypothetical protein